MNEKRTAGMTGGFFFVVKTRINHIFSQRIKYRIRKNLSGLPKNLRR